MAVNARDIVLPSISEALSHPMVAAKYWTTCSSTVNILKEELVDYESISQSSEKYTDRSF